MSTLRLAAVEQLRGPVGPRHSAQRATPRPGQRDLLLKEGKERASGRAMASAARQCQGQSERKKTTMTFILVIIIIIIIMIIVCV